ncbi:MAG: response regulator transcription factor [Lewinellaceae bacterium]|nr:response regulator transcription factor [Saprospiraceae bacterium]MCB9338953.1 response regulator transcription factor [Lewinellaceae bacterium]
MNKQLHLKIFLADDHPVIAHGVSCMLSKQPEIEVVGTALSGEEMFQLLPKARPHILLLDLNMPSTDFYENIAWVKEHAPWVKIIIYSAYYSPELVKSLLHEGVKGYLSKTATPSDLMEALETVSRGEIFVLPYASAQSDSCQQHLEDHPEFQDDFKKRLGLSRREQEILVLISQGLSSQRIGKTLYISKHTVETHRKNILRKLDFNSSTELVRFAVQHGLV